MAERDIPPPSSQPVGSTDQAVAKDNLIVLDNIVVSEELEILNRKGVPRKTLVGMEAEIDGALGTIGGVHIGEYSTNPLIKERNQYVTFGVTPTASQWKITDSTSLDYQIDSATYPDPEDDPNLIMFNDVTREYVNANFDKVGTLSSFVNDVSLQIDGGRVKITDRADGIFDIVEASTVTPDGKGIVQCVGNPLLALVLTAADNVFNLLQYGAPTNGTDALPWVVAAFEGGHKTINITDIFAVNNTVLIQSYMTLNFSGDGAFKAIGILSPLECIMTPDANATDIVVNGADLDADNQPAVSAFFTRLGCNNIKAGKITARNCAHDLARNGGRAVSVHGGGPQGNDNVTIESIHAINCYQALDCVFDDAGNANRNVVINTVVAENCEVLIGTFSANGSFPISPDNQSVVINSVTGRNCGRSDTYTRAHGIINSQQGGNLLINTLTVHNDAAYTNVKKVYAMMGKMSNVVVKAMVITGAVDYVYNNTAWDESDAPVQNDFVSRDMDIDINIVGSAYAPIFSNPTAGSAPTFIRSTFKVKSNAWTQPNVFDFSTTIYSSVYCEMMETTSPRRFTGMMAAMNAIPWTSTGSNNCANIGGVLMLVDTIDGKTYRATLSNGVLNAWAALN